MIRFPYKYQQELWFQSGVLIGTINNFLMAQYEFFLVSRFDWHYLVGTV